MKNNWYVILGLQEVGINDVNIAIVLDEMFKDYVFNFFDKGGNAIVTSKCDGKKYKVIINKKGYFKIKLVVNSNDKTIDEELKISLSYDKKLIKVTLKSRIKNKYKDSSFIDVKSSFLSYKSNCLNGNTSQTASLKTDKYYVDEALKTDEIIPDVSCLTYLKKRGHNCNIQNTLFIESFKISNKPYDFDSNFPIVYLLNREHKVFLSAQDNGDNDVKKLSKRKNKIGF